MLRKYLSVIMVLGLTGIVLAGCAAPPKHARGVAPRVVDPNAQSLGAGTGIESQDLIQVTDYMARTILETPEIVNADKPPIIGLLPVENDTRFPIQKDIFNARIKALLNEHCSTKVRFVDRTRMEAINKERQMKDEGIVTSSGEKQLAGVDYFLTGKLMGMGQVGSTGQSDYVMYTFRLIDAESTIEVWERMREIKKEGLEDVVYR